MSELLVACPICSSNQLSKAFECTDFTVTHQQFSVQRCSTCGFLFTNPRPGVNDIGNYYKSETYISHTNSKKGIINSLYQTIRRRAIDKKLALIESFGPLPKAILDYGCGTGEFLAKAKAAGWVAAGLEPDPDARKLAIANYELNIGQPSDLQSFETGQFGVITLWHVLEHVHLLQETITQFHKILSSAGILIIAVPNAKSHDAAHYKEFWAAYDVPRHLYHFTRADMSKLMEMNGFKVESVSSLFYDPFYISLLSEKYKNGWKNPIKATLTGLKTTLKGRKNIDANSSLLYVMRKK